jgi:molecular chaperone DnaK (HSP70)
MATFGIDLGTTYSCLARLDGSGTPLIVRNGIGEEATPSVVFFESPHRVVVGREAKNAARSDADLVVSLIKRKMGKKDVALEFHGTSHTPESISAFILRDLVTSARETTGEVVRDVVITVPAYFGVAERHATRVAGEMAGLTVVNVVPEPVAAALYYGALTPGSDRAILVYDLGGGTFDTTVIQLSGGDVTVVCTDGDHALGGADWDDRIAEYLRDGFLAEYPDSGADDSEDFFQELTLAAEDVKKALTSRQTARHAMRFGGRSVRAELTRATFEDITAELLERTMNITERTLDSAHSRGIGRLDDVLLVGGSTRMPAVAAALKRRFGFTPKVHDPDLAVAKGAAMFALVESVKLNIPDGQAHEGGSAVSRQAAEQVAGELGMSAETVLALADRKVTTVVPRAFGVMVLDPRDPSEQSFVVNHLLHANTPLPVKLPTEQFFTGSEGQRQIEIEIYEQAGSTESIELEDNNRIGGGVIRRLPSLPKGSPIDITFEMDEGGLLRVNAKEVGMTGQTLDIELQIGDLTQKEITEARDAVARMSS